MRQRSLTASEWAETDATTATGTPSAPVLTLVGVIANSVIINWEPASCAEEHAIYRNATGITQYSMPLGTVAVDATLIYTDNFEVEHETKYYYFVIPQRSTSR